MVGVLIKYKKTESEEELKSYIEGEDYESILSKFIKIKGGASKISVQSIQDWDRLQNQFMVPKPITIDDKNSVVYKIMKSYHTE